MTHRSPRDRVVHDLALVGRPVEDRFDRVVRLAQELFHVPIVAINLVQDDEVHPLAVAGGTRSPIPSAVAFCSTTVRGEGQMLVADTARDARFSDNPLVTEDPRIRFYAGQPLSAHGQRVGTLCLLDDEPRDLTVDESRMLRDLGRWVEQEIALDHEALQAREVQRRLLPRRTPDVPGLEVAASCVPAREVGGDLYDWQLVGDRLQVLLVDVMGKGITAAVLAAGIRAVLRGVSVFNPLSTSVGRVAKSTEEDFADSAAFATLFAARVDPADGSFEYVDAGHGLAVVVGPDGEARQLRSESLPIGIAREEQWLAIEDRLEPGETLLVVSDGVLDAFPDMAGVLAGLRSLMVQHPDAETLVDRIVSWAATHAPPMGQSDDITAVAVTRPPRR